MKTGPSHVSVTGFGLINSMFGEGDEWEESMTHVYVNSMIQLISLYVKKRTAIKLKWIHPTFWIKYSNNTPFTKSSIQLHVAILQDLYIFIWYINFKRSVSCITCMNWVILAEYRLRNTGKVLIYGYDFWGVRDWSPSVWNMVSFDY